MKILSFHPFSLYANGGGSRILRRLYQGHEDDVTTLVIAQTSAQPMQGNIKEITVNAHPLTQPWARWKLRDVLIWMRKAVFKPRTIRKIQAVAADIDFDVLHIVNHDTFSTSLYTAEICLHKQLWVSFHDHYHEIKSPKNDTALLWNNADRRLVISQQLGEQYRQEFGDQPYEIITDGVTEDEITNPKIAVSCPISIYFAGLLHITYLPLFETLADALDKLSLKGKTFNLVLRGTQDLKFLQNRLFATEYRPMTLDSDELKRESDAADILYLPIKFTSPEFYLYSLSTKMVGYLAASGTILYHGPIESAAAVLLQQHKSAVCCGTLKVDDLVDAIEHAIHDNGKLSVNAKRLVRDRFDLNIIRERFWMTH